MLHPFHALLERGVNVAMQMQSTAGLTLKQRCRILITSSSVVLLRSVLPSCCCLTAPLLTASSISGCKSLACHLTPDRCCISQAMLNIKCSAGTSPPSQNRHGCTSVVSGAVSALANELITALAPTLLLGPHPSLGPCRSSYSCASLHRL